MSEFTPEAIARRLEWTERGSHTKWILNDLREVVETVECTCHREWPHY